jgi:HPt (histidine-containing phosphotransfer) domain-containing protein
MNAGDAIGDILDTAELWERVDDDRALLGQLVHVFEDDAPRLLLRIGTSIERTDRPSLARALHAAKGALAIFAPRLAVKTVRELEELCSRGDLSGATEVHARLVHEVDQMMHALRKLDAQDDN